MTNEEAFEKFWEDRQAKGLDAANRCEYEETWRAAIAYMQEQNKSAEQSEPVAWMEEKEDAGYKEIKVWQEPVSKKSIALYTTPQRVEASSTGVATRQLKRLDAGKIGFIFRKEMTLFEFYNALMDATEELNHD